MDERTAVEVKVLRGGEVLPWLPAVAALRIEVFRDWPYLYAGDADYEARYLSAYAQSPHAVFVLALDAGTVVGASTGIPLADDGDAFQAPFRARGIAVAPIFYCGESVLRRDYRGRGLGHRFFDEREAHARRLGRFRQTAFCAVERADDDPRRPPGYRGNEVFWRKRGYQRQDGLSCELDWPEVDGRGEVRHRLTFWLRGLD